MQWKNNNKSYSTISKHLHWFVALSMIVTFIMGQMLDVFEDTPIFGVVMSNHKSFGVLILLMVVIRLFWWSFAKLPEPLAGQSNIAQLLAKAVKLGFIIVMVMLPVSGLIVSNTAGYPVTFFGIYELPALFVENNNLNEVAEDMHEFFVNVFVFLFILHIVGALKHHFFDKDDTLKRMIYGKTK